jgi:hypothetical protein
MRNRLNEQFSRIFPSKMRFLRCGVFLRPAGLEPTTYGSGGRRSIQLNYGRRNELKATCRQPGLQLPNLAAIARAHNSEIQFAM